LTIKSFQKNKIPNPKHQISNKSQISITNDQNIHSNCVVSLRKLLSVENYAIWHKLVLQVFGILNFGHWDLFVFWDLEIVFSI